MRQEALERFLRIAEPLDVREEAAGFDGKEKPPWYLCTPPGKCAFGWQSIKAVVDLDS
jgi:hypothetical protein